MDEDSTNIKKKRGRSLIFRKVFRKTSSSNSGKILASDDNLVYCDVTHNPVEPEIKKSTSTRGRMSRIFKGVLFDAAMKKKICRKKSSKISNDSVDSSPERDGNIDNSLNDDNLEVEEVLEPDNSINDRFNEDSLPPKDVASDTDHIVSSEFSLIDPSTQTMTERKSTSRVNSMKKVVSPIPNSQPSVKPVMVKDTKPDTLNNTTLRLGFFILVGVFVLVVMWMSYGSIATKSLDIEPHQQENVVIVGDEL